MSQPVKPGSPTAAIIEEEERMLARVQSRVSVGPKNLQDRVGAADFDRELIELRDSIAEAKPEDLPALVEQMTRMSAIRGRLGGSQVLPIDLNSPYFAHMALREGEKRRDVLIGKRGFIDRQAGVQIVDWRNAPISQIYYRYDEGDDYDEDMGGRSFAGLVEVRRNISIASSRLRRIGTPQGTLVRDAKNVWHEATGDAAPSLKGGQGKAARAPKLPVRRKGGKTPATLGVHHGPSHRSDKHLPEIAALIDREQFDLITRPESGMVVIQGGAGSGKTTVALHRVAYLNFAAPAHYRANQILFVVPTQSLARYVADVLPSLGVKNVPVVTYSGWARGTRVRLLKGTSGKYNDDTPEFVSTIKKHPAILDAIETFVREQETAAHDDLLRVGDDIAAEFTKLERLALVPRLRRLRRSLETLSAVSKATRVAADSAIRQLLARADDVLVDWSELLTDRERLRSIVDQGVASQTQLERFIAWCSAQQETDGGAVGSDGRALSTVDGRDLDEGSPAGRFDEEDDPILLRLIQLKRGRLSSRDSAPVSYRHVAIDEAQDRSALEVKVLLEAIERQDDGGRSVTIAGDTAQRLVFDNAFSGWEKLLGHVGENAAVVSPLKLSYRSTAEVMQLSRDVLGPELAPDEAVTARSGAPVELHEFGDAGEAVAFLADALRALCNRERTASTAVISKYPEQADVYYQGLQRAEVPKLRRVRRHDFSFTAGIDVTDIAQVKGLEFDYVVMVDVNAATYPDNVEMRHLLHIGMTRAAHQLWLISTGAPSPCLPAALRLGT